MAKVNFTADRVAAFQCETGKQQSIMWDAKTPGLGLRITAAGARSYIFETRLQGKTLRITIGDVRTWTVAKAQAEATRYKAQTDQGIDPREVRASQRAQADAAQLETRRQAVTLESAWPVYLAARKSKWGDRTYTDHVKLADKGGQTKKRGKGETGAGPLAALLPELLTDLTGERIARWLNDEAASRPTSAALSYRLLRGFIRWSADIPEYSGLVPSDAYTARAVRDALPKVKTKEGDCLQREQLKDWFTAVCKIGSPVISTYLQALLITGARREEMAALRWDDIDFKWRSLSIRDKVEGSRIIPLTPYLAALLETLKRINNTPPPVKKLRSGARPPAEWAPSPWVFSSSSSESGRLAEPRIAHNEALAVAGLPHLTLHGLRRSFGTLCEWVEVPSGVSAQIMGHKPSALAEKHYRRRPLDMLRKWHDQIEEWVLAQAGIQFQPAPASLKIVGK
ncbi:tyrosine-type recombinase/integrase [Duganella sp. S19_KUP01_CR8]|uniref:tyrosine-type recombinase/integrase n=1 Tax=Duganella sp. S19_KUP01_CR8 TaxID=3025502 RepID=UPI002FCDD7B0